MAEHTTAATLDELEKVRAKVRSDRRPVSVSLAVLASAMTLFAAIQWIEWLGDENRPFEMGGRWWPDGFVFLAAPVGFALIALRYRAVELRRGVRSEWRVFVMLAIAALLLLFVAPRALFVPQGLPFGVIGLALLVVAWWQRSGLLAAGALIFGVGGALETYYVLTNRFYEVYGGFVTWATVAVWTVLSVALWVLAVVAWKREVGT